MLSLIVAVDRNGLIGREGTLPWHVPADLKHFKAFTMGKPLIMGRKTCLSLGRPLPGRRNLVLTRNPAFSASGFEVFTDPQTLLEAVVDCEEAVVIGGAEIYRLFLPQVTQAYVTVVDEVFAGDTYFPVWPLTDPWCLMHQDERAADDKNSFALSFRLYKKLEKD